MSTALSFNWGFCSLVLQLYYLPCCLTLRTSSSDMRSEGWELRVTHRIGIIMRTLRLNISSAINCWGPARPSSLGWENDLSSQQWEKQPGLTVLLTEHTARQDWNIKIHQKQNKDVVGPVVALCHHLLSLLLRCLFLTQTGVVWCVVFRISIK